MRLTLKQFKAFRPWQLLCCLAVIWGFGLSSPVRAQAVSADSEKTAQAYQPSVATDIEQVAISLAVVLLLIFILAWLVKRFAPGAARMGNRDMRVLSVLTLGGKERLMLVDVAGQQMVLGVSAAGIQCLHVFEEPPLKAAQTEEAGSQFSKILQSFQANRDNS